MKRTPSSFAIVLPMAQDFYAAFGIGEDDLHHTAIDENGVALAAVKGLSARLGRKNADVRRLSSQVAELRAELHNVETSLAGKQRR